MGSSRYGAKNFDSQIIFTFNYKIMKILGISAFFHDSSATLIVDGKIIAAVQEERFSRIKNDASFPEKSIAFCFNEAGMEAIDLDAIVFYEKPFLKFERIVDELINQAPFGLISFAKNMPIWVKQKLFMKRKIKEKMNTLFGEINWNKTELLFSKHHLSHAASSFFVSPFKDAAILTIDGVGEIASATISKGSDSKIETLKELNFPNSVGLFYSAFTAFLGFEVNNGEYKVMGLAPYAFQKEKEVQNIIDKLKKNVITIHETGAIHLNPNYFQFNHSSSMLKTIKVEELLSIKAVTNTNQLSSSHVCLAQAIQLITEEVLLKMVQYTKQLFPSDNLCLAGGLALNCVANGKIKESAIFKNVYIQPAAGDAGGSLGAAIACYYMHFKKERKDFNEIMQNALLGPSYSEKEIIKALNAEKVSFNEVTQDIKIKMAIDFLLEGKSIGWFQGKMEFGPRALGNRSILANPLLSKTQSDLNLKVKKRESFRPFAPILLNEEFEKYFGQNYSSPYMLFAHKLKKEYRQEYQLTDNLIESINQNRSPFPSVSHVDYSSRIQTVDEQSNPTVYKLLKAFKEKTGFGVLVNTSFNVKDEPIVCSPSDAIRCFLQTDIDVLIIDNFIVEKRQL